MEKKITRRENMLMAYRHEKPLFIPSGSDQQFLMPKPVMGEAAMPGHSVDWYGVPFYMGEDQPGPMPDYDFPFLVTDITKWREVITWPNLDDYDWEGGAAEDALTLDRENKVLNILIVNGLWERFHAFLGMEEAFVALYEEPEETKALLEKIADFKVDMINHFGQYYHPDKLQFHDDYGTERGLFMSVEMWREFIKPNLQKIIDACHANGIIYEHHSCGCVHELLDDLIEMGIDAWNPVQEMNKPLELIDKYEGKLTFVGGFNARCLENKDPETVEWRKNWIVERLDALKDRKGWIFAPYNCGDLALFCEQEIWKRNKPIYDELGLEGPLFDFPTGVQGGITESAEESFEKYKEEHGDEIEY